MAYVPAEKNRVDQDLRTATVAICRGLYEFGPCQCNLSQLFHLLACTDSELSNNRLYQGFNERDLNSTTRDSIYDHYINVGYKGTGVETINNVVLLDNAELTALLTLEIFSAETELPEAKSKDELFALFRPQLEDPEKLNLLIQKWELFKPHFAKVKDADDKLGKRLKMMVPWSGQNRVGASYKVSLEADHSEMFKVMQHWTMTFWSLSPRAVTKYLSMENQGRDSCKQTILPSELILRAAEGRNKIIPWDSNHTRWCKLTESEQNK